MRFLELGDESVIECMQNQGDEKQTLGKIKNWKEIVIQGSSLKKSQ